MRKVIYESINPNVDFQESWGIQTNKPQRGEQIIPTLCSPRKNPYSKNSLGVRGSQRPKNLSKCMKLDWNFQRGGVV